MTRPTVVKIGGATLEDPRTSPQLWDALAALSRTRPVVVVHGGGKAVDRLLDKLGMPVERKQGLRVTPPEQMDIIAGVLAGTLNKTIVAALIRRGASAVGLSIGDAGVPSDFKRVEGLDLGLVGEVTTSERREGSPLEVLLREGYLPVLSSIGISREGVLLNLNADDAAAGVAWHARAETLVLMTDVPGILDAHKQLIPELDGRGIETLISEGVISGGMIPKARAAVSAVAALGAPVVILSGNNPESLARWAAGNPAGTTIVQSSRERS
jgi:acetylglutamate kinase